MNMGEYYSQYKSHLQKHNLEQVLINANNCLFDAYLRGRFDIVPRIATDFDTKFIETLDNNTLENYFLSTKLLDEHFMLYSASNTVRFQCVYLYRSQEQYAFAVHYLNKLMMKRQLHLIHKERIRLLSNEGTNDGSYRPVAYNYKKR